MRTITLEKLVLQNFKGFTFVLDTCGGNADVYGQNASGKTTLADAFSWLLFGKDSLGRADFEIKTLDGNGNRENNLNHTVEATLQIDSVPITLKKTYHEVWTKKRGSVKATFSGNTTDHFIDGVPTKELEYRNRIAEIAGDEAIFRMLTSPTVFPSLPWQRQRSLLLDICGDYTDAQVIESDSALAPLTALLQKYTVSKTPLEDLKKVITARRSEINKYLDQLPVRIDEVKRGLPDITGLNRATIEAEASQLETSLNDAKLRLQGIDNGGNIAELSKKLQIVNADIRKMEQEHIDRYAKEISRISREIEDKTEAARREERKSSMLKSELSWKKNDLEGVETQLQKLRDKWFEIDAEVFEDHTEDVCPACKHSLPSERVEAARDKAMAEFNRSKAERLTGIDAQGKTLTEKKNYILSEIEKINTEIASLPMHQPEDMSAITEERDRLKEAANQFELIPGCDALIAQKVEIEKQIQAEREGKEEDRSLAEGEVQGLDQALRERKTDLDKFVRRAAGEKRINELMAEEKTLAVEFERLEKELYLCEQFIKRKVQMLTERINEKFQIVNFKLFNQNINGGIEPCCELTINGVPYSGGLNNAARIQGGCDIINTLQDHHGLVAPLFCDNRESVTDLPKMQCQVISLIVSPADTVLRVETRYRIKNKEAYYGNRRKEKRNEWGTEGNNTGANKAGKPPCNDEAYRC